MSPMELVRQKYGTADPLEGVPDVHRAEAEETIATWADPSRGDLRMLATACRVGVAEQWKRSLYAKIVARFAMSCDFTRDRHRLAALAVLGVVDADFAVIAKDAQRKARRRGKV